MKMVAGMREICERKMLAESQPEDGGGSQDCEKPKGTEPVMSRFRARRASPPRSETRFILSARRNGLRDPSFDYGGGGRLFG